MSFFTQYFLRENGGPTTDDIQNMCSHPGRGKHRPFWALCKFSNYIQPARSPTNSRKAFLCSFEGGEARGLSDQSTCSAFEWALFLFRRAWELSSGSDKIMGRLDDFSPRYKHLGVAWGTLPYYGITPYKPSGTAKFPKTNHEFSGKFSLR